MVLAEKLMTSCYEMYRQVPCGLSPEIVVFTEHASGYPKEHQVLSAPCCVVGNEWSKAALAYSKAMNARWPAPCGGDNHTLMHGCCAVGAIGI
jgi:hypothetical protein